MRQQYLKWLVLGMFIWLANAGVFACTVWAAHRTLISYNGRYSRSGVLDPSSARTSVSWHDIWYVRPTLLKWDWFLPIVFSLIFTVAIRLVLDSFTSHRPSGLKLGAGLGAVVVAGGLTVWIHSRLLNVIARNDHLQNNDLVKLAALKRESGHLAHWITAGMLALAVISLAYLGRPPSIPLSRWIRRR